MLKNGSYDTGSWPSSNYNFTLNSKADVTIYFNSSSNEIAVDSAGLGTWKLDYIFAAGNGSGTWLNGEDWNISTKLNKMKEVKPGIWEISFENVKKGSDYKVKFACNGAWQPYNWGIDGTLDKADPQPGNTVAQDGSTVTLRLDVTGFNF